MPELHGGRAAARIGAIIAGLAALALPLAGHADHGHTHRPPGFTQHPPRWQGHDIRRFHERDFDHWRAGQWHRGWHDGRLAWWWVFGGLWYPYEAPVYPYPDPYRPPSYYAAPVPAPSAPPGQGYYYYCQNPAGYYPYVADCPGGWQAVPPPQ
ncbi:MAG: hypothetical protein IT562_23605 [Alphaproteobacteria bacterium]|nr:hypothetical protein [Alphaproteobacteria bacterium]